MLHGIGASEGIGIGTAVLVAEPDLDYSHVTPPAGGREGPPGRGGEYVHPKNLRPG